VSVRVIALSDAKRDPLIDVANELATRTIRRYGLELVLLKPGRRVAGTADQRVREAEGARLLEASRGCTRIALDASGRSLDTPQFAAGLEKRLADGRDVAFLIGGATGLSQEVLETAADCWSLSPLTFAHRLAVLVLVEQIYRAGEVSRGGPYAK
jgi:23S rRNA (pseudouridine1915-N3)-methyltransferase